jgi:histidyl-tRNA synthetase
MERVLLLLQEKHLLPAQRSVDVYLVQQGDGAPLYAMKLAKQLREAGYSVVQHMGEGSFKSQMKKADGSGARYAVIVGENEIASGQATLKPLRGDVAQQTVTLAELVASLGRLDRQGE